MNVVVFGATDLTCQEGSQVTMAVFGSIDFTDHEVSRVTMVLFSSNCYPGLIVTKSSF